MLTWLNMSARTAASAQPVKVRKLNSNVFYQEVPGRGQGWLQQRWLKTNGHFNGTSAVIKLPPSRRTKPRRASEQAAGSLRGYVLLTTLKTLADESSQEIDEGENRGGKEAAWHCFHFCIQKRWTCPPPCLNCRGYDRSSDRDVVLLQGWMAFFFLLCLISHTKKGQK